MELYPKDVMLFLYDPKKTYHHVLVELKDEPGALSDAAARVAKAKINVLTGFTSTVSKGEIGLWSFFGEPRAEPPGVEKLTRILSASPLVKLVKVNESEDGLLIDNMHFPLRFTPARHGVAFNPESLASMFNNVTATFGDGGILILYEQGMAVGRAGGAFLVETIGREVVNRKIGRVGDLLSGYGWGLVESLDVDKGAPQATMKVRHCFEAMTRNGKAPTCHFVRGMLAGIFEEIWDREMKAEEISCASQGNELCEFRVIPR